LSKDYFVVNFFQIFGLKQKSSNKDSKILFVMKTIPIFQITNIRNIPKTIVHTDFPNICHIANTIVGGPRLQSKCYRTILQAQCNSKTKNTWFCSESLIIFEESITFTLHYFWSLIGGGFDFLWRW